MDLEHVFGPGLSVQVVYALRDDDHGAPLLLQPGFALRYGQMNGAGLLVQHKLPPVVVELPYPGRGAGEGFWSCEVLRTHSQRQK